MYQQLKKTVKIFMYKIVKAHQYSYFYYHINLYDLYNKTCNNLIRVISTSGAGGGHLPPLTRPKFF